jgi:serine/threonine protein kinase
VKIFGPHSGIVSAVSHDFTMYFDLSWFHSGHYHLWEAGVHHRDISVNNLMYDKASSNAGVLIDFDLAVFNNDLSPWGFECTGTIPFMALQLIDPNIKSGSIKHAYHHDWESFIWVLFWIFGCYKDGQELSSRSRAFELWLSPESHISYKCKLADLIKPRGVPIMRTFEHYKERLYDMLQLAFDNDKQTSSNPTQPSSPERDKKLYDDLLQLAFPEPEGAMAPTVAVT